MHKPLAVIEAKRTCVDVSKSKQQAKLCADILEKQYGRQPATLLIRKSNAASHSIITLLIFTSEDLDFTGVENAYCSTYILYIVGWIEL